MLWNCSETSFNFRFSFVCSNVFILKINANSLIIRTAYKRVLNFLRLNGYPLIHTGIYTKKEVIKIFIVLNDIKHEDSLSKKQIVYFLNEQYNDPKSLIYREKTMPVVKLSKRKLRNRKKRVPKSERKPRVNKFRQKYLDYLDSKKWKDFRDSIKAERGNKCEICHFPGGKGVILDGHHLTYVRLFNELPEDIQIVCRDCHKKIHGH